MNSFLRSTGRALVVVGILLSALPSFAQTTGTFFGVVTDLRGAAIPNVKILAKSPQTGLTRSAESDIRGEYAIPLLPPGVYDIEAEAPNFERYINRNVTLLVNQTVHVDIQMRIGAVTEKVEVSGEVSGVDTSTATISTVINTSKIIKLPLNGRNFLQLTTLVPGAVPGIQMTENFTPTTAGSSSLSVPQVNGIWSGGNNILLDGVDDNEPFLGAAAAIPAPDGIQEFSILTNMYGAEFGKGAGAIVNVVTKSGTDAFHGSLYDYLRNDALDARNFFALPGAPAPKLIRNQFGGSVGGPVLKQRTHFFFNYEGFRERQGSTRTATVPSIREKLGDFSQSASKPIDPMTGLRFPSDQIPDNRIDPVAKKLLQFYPDPNIGTNLFTSSPVSPTDQNQYLVRIDHKLTEKDNLFGRYFLQDGSNINPFSTTFLGAVNVPTFPVLNDWRFHHLVLSEVHVFSEALVNEFRFGLNRNVLVGIAQAISRKKEDFGFTYPTTIPDLFPHWTPAGFTSNGSTDMGPGNKAVNVFQWLDILSYRRGRHMLKMGADIKRQQMNSAIPSGLQGAFSFTGAVSRNSWADFLLGRPFFFFQGGGNFGQRLRSSNFDFFGEDQISLSRNLKLTLGLRYELPTWPYDIDNHIAAFRPGQQSTVRPDAFPGLVYPGDKGISRSTVDNPKKNFAPRIGLAWDPTGGGRTSIRAGYGIFYTGIPLFSFFQQQVAPPFFFFATLFLPQAGLADPFNGTSPFLPGLTEFKFSHISPGLQVNLLNENLKTPYAQQYNLTIQHELFRGWVFQAAYVGTTGVHLPNTLDLNQAVFVPGASTISNINSRRPFQPFGSLFAQSTVFNSKYDSFQFSVNKRVSRGLAFLAAYTFSKSLDEISVPQRSRIADGQQRMVMNQLNPKLDHGPSAFDATHRFVLSYVWEFPRFQGNSRLLQKILSGWGVNGIVAFQSGLPFTVIDPTDPTVDGVAGSNDRADLVGDPNSGERTLQRWFNTAAFQRLVSPSGRYGTEGRNILRGPGINNWDFSIVKTTQIKETSNIEFRAEFFNLWNHPQFTTPVSDITSPSFGRILATRPNVERQVQLVLRLNF